MAQKKERTAPTDGKPKARVEDLAPKKDAKGGGPRPTTIQGSKGLQGGTTNPLGGTKNLN